MIRLRSALKLFALTLLFAIFGVGTPSWGAGSYTAHYSRWTDNGTPVGQFDEVYKKGFAGPQDASDYMWPKTNYKIDSYSCEFTVNDPYTETVVFYRRGVAYFETGSNCALNGISGQGLEYRYSRARPSSETSPDGPRTPRVLDRGATQCTLLCLRFIRPTLRVHTASLSTIRLRLNQRITVAVAVKAMAIRFIVESPTNFKSKRITHHSAVSVSSALITAAN